MQIRNILVPIDFSDGAHAAMDAGISVARRFDAAVHVVHIFDVPMLHAETMIQVAGSPPVSLVDHMRQDFKRMLDDFIEDVDTRGVVFSRGLEIGPPTSTIIKLSDDYDLIVMGTHGRTGFKRLILGSVAEEVVREAHAPVLVVHAADAKKVKS